MDNTSGTICDSPRATLELGYRLGETLEGGEIILLSGGLGAGKTLFTKGILDALGYDPDEVTSPSFTLVNHYRTSPHEVYHVDLWRLEGTAEVFHSVGLDELLENEQALVIIEWPDRLPPHAFNRDVIEVEISGHGDEERRIKIIRDRVLGEEDSHKESGPLAGAV